MSDFKQYKKADLARVAAKVGISVRSKDTKLSLLEKIERFLEESPEKARDMIHIEDEDEDDAEVVTLVDENDVSEDEDEEDDENDENDDEVEEVDGEDAEDAEDAEEDEDESIEEVAEELAEEDEDDKDYDAPPPINLKEWIVDPAITAFEAAHDKVLELTDRVGITTLEINDDLRDHLSQTTTLNILEAMVEVSHFLYFYVPMVPLKYNASVHQVFRDNVPQLNEWALPVPDVTGLFNVSVASILLNWGLFAVFLPLVISYYVNFSRRVVTFEVEVGAEDDEVDEDAEEGEDEDEDEDEDERITEDLLVVIRAHKYDPFIFALSKVLIYYLIHQLGVPGHTDTYAGVFQAVRNLVFIQFGIYRTFVSSLGTFPLIFGLANVVIALYSQFEDY